MTPCLRRRLVSRDPRVSRFLTISFVRSPAIPAAECSGDGVATCTIRVVFEELLQSWDGEEAVIRYDPESGAWMFVCVHSTALWPAGGGTRMRAYASPGDGLADAMRLSGAMTRKMAGPALPSRGGNAALAVPPLPA